MIVFEKLTFQNFLSAGNKEVCIELNETKTTLIHGTNGSGKSTILDALCYALFNKPFRRINLPQLINTQNKKGLVVTVFFTIGKTQFIVRRGMKPRLFEIYRDGELLDSKAADRDNQAYLEQNVLKLSYKSFTQIVILGSSNFIPFMQLPCAGRRECVEDFLDIKVFSAMGIIAKERLRGLKERMTFLKGDIGNIEYKIDVQEQHIKQVEEKSQADTEKLHEKMMTTKAEMDKLNEVITYLNSNIEAQEIIITELNKARPSRKIGALKEVIAKLQTKIERNEKNITFYQDSDTCHTCKQTIDAGVKKKYVKESRGEVRKFTKGIEEAQEQIAKFQDSERVLNNNKTYINTLYDTVKSYTHKQDAQQNILRHTYSLLQEVETSSQSIDKDRGKLELLQEELKESQQKLYELMVEVQEHEIVVNLLRDSGIKTQIVKKYLPVMNKLIRRHLEEFDLPIHFKLDEEFNETVQSPLHQDFSYASFSEGQKSRIDLALMFTWREIGKIKNSVTTNLLVLDEVFSSSLDEEGKERLINYLRYKLDDNQRVVVVDHTLSGNFKEKFDRCIEATRIGGFSRYT